MLISTLEKNKAEKRKRRIKGCFKWMVWKDLNKKMRCGRVTQILRRKALQTQGMARTGCDTKGCLARLLTGRPAW